MNTLRSLAHRFVIGLGIASLVVAAAPAAASASAVAAEAPARVVAAAVAAPPAGFIKHTSRFWTWFGPRNWIASYSTYGLTVTSPGAVSTWDYGGSSTLCVAATTWNQSAARYFNARRVAVAKGARASVFKWVSVGKISVIGVRSYRQTDLFDATIKGKTIRGKLTFVYSDNGGGYCYQSSDARVCLKSVYGRDIKTMDAMAKYTTYLGPGVCDPSLFLPTRC